MDDNIFDIAFAAGALIIALFAFFKGFSRELCSSINWTIALLATYFFGDPIAKQINPHIASQYFSIIFAKSGVFIIILLLVSVITSKTIKPILTKIPASLDQSMGFMYGFFKTYLIACFAFIIITNLYKSGIFFTKTPEVTTKNQKFGPYWMRTAQSYNMLEFGANKLEFLIKPLIPDFLNHESEIGKKKMKEINKESEVVKAIKELSEAEKEGGYSIKEIQKMQRIINIIK